MRPTPLARWGGVLVVALPCVVSCPLNVALNTCTRGGIKVVQKMSLYHSANLEFIACSISEAHLLSCTWPRALLRRMMTRGRRPSSPDAGALS